MNPKAQDMKQTLLLCYAGLVASSAAIVVEDYTTAEAAPSGHGYDLNWNYVYSYNGASAVAVSNHWIVTAWHVGWADSFSVDEVDYYSQARFKHPSADLALIYVDKALPGYYDLYTGPLPAHGLDPKLDVLVVGYGTKGTVASTSWTTEGGSGVKRWGTQQIDASSTSAKTFSMNFDLNRTSHEAGTGDGDSGSGVFYEEGGTWKLAGINTKIYPRDPPYDRIEGVPMPAVAEWVVATMSTVPEPAAIGLTGFGTIGLFLARSRRRRKWAGRSVFPIKGDEPLCDRFDDTAAADEALDEAGICFAVVSGLKRVGIRLAAVWMNHVYGRCKALNEASWNFFIAAADRVAAGKTVVGRKRFKTAAAKRLDAFLEGISWDRIIIALKSAKARSNRALTKSMCRCLDVFLEILRWDQMVSAFRRFRRRIRFYRNY
jgi:hypothetical protein